MGFFMYSDIRPKEEYRWNNYSTVIGGSAPDYVTRGNSVGFLYPYYWNGSDFTLIDYLKTCVPQDTGEGYSEHLNSYANIFNDSLPWYDPNYIKTTALGDDGKVVGPYGGTGFSLYPSVPRITESKIDTYTDGEGKLNVKVKVEVGQ